MRYLLLPIGCLSFLLSSCTRPGAPATIDLSGDWAFQIDSLDVGQAAAWYDRPLSDRITLPGSMAENGLGEEVSVRTRWTGNMWNDSLWYTSPKYARYRQAGNVKPSFWLTPKRVYTGPAWYQRSITVPEAWAGRHLELHLERPHWKTTLWVNANRVGQQDFLATPHRYVLGSLPPGKHTLTIRVDNSYGDIDVGRDAHSVSDNTQTNWNGIVGNLTLRALPKIRVVSVRVRPDEALQNALVEVILDAPPGPEQNVTLRLAAQPRGPHAAAPPELTTTVSLSGPDTLELSYPMGENPSLWDEFSPQLYDLTVSIKSPAGTDQRTEPFGMRRFRPEGSRFTINGRPVFLRGTLECAIFPRTGYPPTDEAAWRKIYAALQDHGLNHLRFHSWCPPKAAFTAADEMGIYLQVEASTWSPTLGEGGKLDEWLYREGENIIREYGNHPSFVMMAHGNEPRGNGRDPYLTAYVNHFQHLDSSKVYAPGSGWPYLDNADFHVTAQPRIQHWNEGLGSLINRAAPQTTFDYQNIVEKTPMPVVAHEIGQWCVYPNFREMDKYTGVLEPRNFEIFRESLQEAGMGHLADSFLLASGKLQALCYKADIEAALRTEGFGGFQLLDLHDFPGQGTALVGVLDAFWEEKGYITPEAFGQFCGPTTPLARFPRRVFRAGDTLVVPTEVAHFGAAPLLAVRPRWWITDEGNRELAGGTLPPGDIPLGNGHELGTITHRIPQGGDARKRTFHLQVGEHENSWAYWVYPRQLPERSAAGIRYARSLDAATRRHLENGGTAVLQIPRDRLRAEAGGDIALGFSSIFWNTSWTNGQAPHTLGILCQPDHPALRVFPTDYHSDWQWWEPLQGAAAINLAAVHPDVRPIVRIIDDWFENRPTALLFEVKVGNGKLLVAGLDLESDLAQRPVVRQLRYSLEQYLTGPHFQPTVAVAPATIEALLKTTE